MEGPNRLKHFMWRLAHNSLALRSNLSRRGMKIDPRCPLCNYAWEDGGHLFLRCKHVKAVWRCAGLEDLRVELTNCHDAKEVVSTILSKDNEVQVKASFLLNNVWHERNSVREGNQRRLSEVLASLSGKQATEIMNLSSPAPASSSAHGRSRTWERPFADTLKINADGAFRENDKNGGWGYVIQSASGRLRFASSPLHMEVLACLEGVKAAASLGLHDVCLETDAQQVVWAVQGDEFRLSLVGGLVHNLKEIITENFVNFHVRYVPRQCSCVAHELASIGSRSVESDSVVTAGVPDCILYFFLNNLYCT